MSTTTWNTRLFGGRAIGVTYDSVANTISILGQSISVASLSSQLQAAWAAAVANTPVSIKAPFGGDGVGAAVGSILDNQPTWRNAVQNALAGYVGEQTLGNQASDPSTWTWGL